MPMCWLKKFSCDMGFPRPSIVIRGETLRVKSWLKFVSYWKLGRLEVVQEILGVMVKLKDLTQHY